MTTSSAPAPEVDGDQIVATFELNGDHYEIDDLGSGNFPDQDGAYGLFRGTGRGAEQVGDFLCGWYIDDKPTPAELIETAKRYLAGEIDREGNPTTP